MRKEERYFFLAYFGPAPRREGTKQGGKIFFVNMSQDIQLFCSAEEWVRRDRVSNGKSPNRDQVLRRMWTLANADARDAVKLAYFSEEELEQLDGLKLDALVEFKRGSNGVVEMKFADRTKLLERLLDAVDRGGEEQVDRFLRAMEGREE